MFFMESEMLKMNEVRRVWVGLARKSSWSWGVRIRRVGWVKVMSSMDGGGGSVGVVGADVEDFRADASLPRGVRRGRV